MVWEIISTIGTMVAAIVACIAVIIDVCHHRAEDNRHKMEESLTAFIKLENEAIIPLYQFKPIEIKSASENPQDSKYKDITHYMDLIELYLIGVDNGVYKDYLFDKFEPIRLTRLLTNLQCMIQAKRKLSHTDVDYKHIEALYMKLKSMYPYIK